MRAFLLDADRLPRKDSEVQDVVRWRLKKLLPVAPTELRLSVVRLPETVAGVRFWFWRASNARWLRSKRPSMSIGIQPGLITTRLFALIPRLSVGDRPLLLIQLERGFLSLILLVGGEPRLLRTKPLSPMAAVGDSRSSASCGSIWSTSVTRSASRERSR